MSIGDCGFFFPPVPRARGTANACKNSEDAVLKLTRNAGNKFDIILGALAWENPTKAVSLNETNH